MPSPFSALLLPAILCTPAMPGEAAGQEYAAGFMSGVEALDSGAALALLERWIALAK